MFADRHVYVIILKIPSIILKLYVGIIIITVDFLLKFKYIEYR